MPVRHRKLAITSALLLLALVIFFALFDWNWFRGPLTRFATQKLGREVSLSHLDVKLRPQPVIVLDGLRVANLPDSAEKNMVQARRILVTLSIPSLFRGTAVIPHIELQQPDVVLERRTDGTKNWVFARPEESKKEDKGAVDVRRISLDQGRIRYDDRMQDVSVDVKAAIADNDVLSRKRNLITRLEFAGRYGKVPFSGSARTGNVLSIRDTGVAFPMAADVRLDKTNVVADGTVTDLLKPSAIDMLLTVSGPSLAALHEALGVPLPETPAYRLNGRFQMKGQRYTYRDFTGRMGQSDLAGTASYTHRKPRGLLEATLKSQRLSLADLGPSIGTGKPESRSARSRRKPARDPGRKVLPDKPFNLAKMNKIDARVSLEARRLLVPDVLPFEDFSLKLALDDGVMHFAPLRMGLAGGKLDADIRLDSRQDPMLVKANMDFRGLQLSELFPTIALMKDSTGTVGADIRLDTRGNSVAKMLGAADGSMQLAMQGGSMSNLLVEIIGLDAAESLRFFLGRDRQTPVRCAAASFKLEKGLANSEVIVFDTQDTRVNGSGHLNFADETMQLTLEPQPKDRSPVSLRVPLHIHGSFGAPDFSLDKKELFLRGAGAVALGAIHPLASVLALLETGPGTHADCAALLKEASAARQNAKPGRARKAAAPARK